MWSITMEEAASLGELLSESESVSPSKLQHRDDYDSECLCLTSSSNIEFIRQAFPLESFVAKTPASPTRALLGSGALATKGPRGPP